MDKYRISVGDGEPKEISGTIVGPFGVAEHDVDGFYRVTHLHSGLMVKAIGCTHRGTALEAAEELSRRVPWWKSKNKDRIAAENGITTQELAKIVHRVANLYCCDGSDDD